MAIFSERLREKIFWATDAVKGGIVKKHVQEINNLLGAGEADAAVIIENKVSKMLHHAINTTNYYKPYAGTTQLKDFPVVDKAIIRANLAAFTSAAFLPEALISTVTSGSTGTPFKVFQHKAKKLRNTADTICFAGKTGYKPGQKLVYLKIWSANNRKSKLLFWLQNIVPVDVISLDDDKVAALLHQLQQNNATYALLGYSSALEVLCHYLDKKNSKPIQATISSAISMSETLNDYTKATIEKYFAVPVYSRYSNVENGILAQQVPGSGGRYLINRASYVIEVLKIDSNEPASCGEPGRIVVTDLYNFATPMIRYDTGDIGIMSKDKCYLEKVEGRKLDLIYDTSGGLVSSYIVYKNMWQYTEITQYQLVQYGPGQYLFKINMDGEFLREAKLVQEFKEHLGADADFKVEYVDEIPLLASGKRKKIVNTYHNQLSTASNV
jgi:phenylacetate-CoA ligase